ncbi:MAG: hypothetical protein CMQ07_02990 [Gammaproteobacteria bacterium]|nr:hypothetical protein [Gammaproteobacteria bacterium]
MYIFRLITLSLIMIPLIGCTSMVTGVSDNAAFIEPMVERRDTLTATGYAVIDVQPSDNSAQRRLLAIRAAKLDAYRGLTEQVYGQYLDATTTVADMAVRSDSFRTRVEGVVYGANLVRIEPRGSDTYEVTMSLDKSIVNDLRVLYLERAFRASSTSTGN